MAANEITNRLHAAVKALGNGTIIARSGAILSVVRTALGTYQVNLVPGSGIASREVSYDTALDGVAGGNCNAVPNNTERFTVFCTNAAGAAADRQWCLTIWRISSSL